MYSVAPGGGFTTTGVGDDTGAAMIGTVGGEVVGVTEGFADGV
jgi:hypothetical protein